DHTCVACLKGKQHKASCKTKLVNSVSKPLHTLHMDLFGPTSISSLNHKWYCLVVTDDFFRCDNGGEFKNQEMNEFCTKKGIKREFSNARTPQQNGVAERRNRASIKATETMLADAKLPVTFWAQAVNTACYVQNRVLGSLMLKGMKVKSAFLYGIIDEELCREFEALMQDKFQMSAMGELTFFLSLQVLQKKDGIFLSQDKYVGDILKKFGYSDVRSMIGSLMYLTASRPDIMFVVCACARHQLTPKECHLHAVKRIFRYLKGHPKLGLLWPLPQLRQNMWQLLVVVEKFFGYKIRCWIMGSKQTDQETKIIATVDGKPRTISESSLRRHLKLNDEEGISSLPDAGLFENLSLMGYNILPSQRTVPLFASMIVTQGEGLAHPTKPHHTPLPQEHQSPQSAYSPQHDSPSLSHQTIIPEPIPHDLQAPTETLTPRRLPKQAIRIAQSKALSPAADEPASLSRDDRHGEAFLTVSSLDARQDKENIAKTSAMSHESSPKKDGIFLSQDKYVGDILKKFRYSDVRSMIRSLMYLTASRPDIMFAVCACARHQVTANECHLHAVKRIFRYLKGHPKLGLWYPKESPFDLVAYSDSDYGGATHDRKSTTGGCQFLRRRLISWQCKKHTIVATSTTKAEYVATASGCGQVLWIQNQMLNYGIETTDQETKIIATVKGKPQTISESSLRRHLKLNDEEVISSFPDAELFENLSLMGYNILPSQRTVPLFSSMIVTQGKGLANPTESHHTPSPQEHQSPQFAYSPKHDSPSLSHQTIIPEPIPRDLQALTETLTPRRLTKRPIRIAHSKALLPATDEPASLSRDDRHGEAFPTISSLDAGQDRKNIAKTSAMSYESSPRVPFLYADEGNKSTEKGSNDTEEMVNVLSSMEAANILSRGGIAFSTASVSPADVFPTAGVLTISGSFPTISVIFTTASVATPYTIRSRGITIGSLWPMRIPIISVKDKGKEKVIETKVPKKKKLQEQIDAQVAREMEEEFARENQRLSEQAARDSEIARIYAEEEIKLMIEGLDRSNEVIAKHLSEYEQAEADLSVGEKIDLISELVKYQDHLDEILKYQAQQSKPSSKKDQRRFYMSVLKSHAEWKTEHFRRMTLV
nr:hypothetical protein [Tanacetum cinerariifolium]